MILPLVMSRVDETMVLFGIGLFLATAPALFEGLRTGVIRAHYVGSVPYGKHPIQFTVHSACFALYAGTGIFVMAHSLLNL